MKEDNQTNKNKSKGHPILRQFLPRPKMQSKFPPRIQSQ